MLQLQPTALVQSLWRPFLAAALALAATAAPAQEAREIDKLFRSGDATLAMQRVDKVIAEKPRDAALRFQRAVMLTELQRTNEAIDALNKLIEDFPDLPEPYNNLAVLLAAKGASTARAGCSKRRCATTPATRWRTRTWATCSCGLRSASSIAPVAAGRTDEALQRKLRLTRDLAAASQPARP